MPLPTMMPTTASAALKAPSRLGRLPARAGSSVATASAVSVGTGSGGIDSLPRDWSVDSLLSGARLQARWNYTPSGPARQASAARCRRLQEIRAVPNAEPETIPTNPAAFAVPVVALRRPYLLFLGAITDPDDAKTAFGLRDWCRSACVGQFRLPGCTVSTGLPDMTPPFAVAAGARSLVIGVAPMGGALDPAWVPALVEALDAGLDLVSGMHTRLATHETLAAAARRSGRRIFDLRRADLPLDVGSGRRRTGRRLLTVGTDCALGKKYTALALSEALRHRGVRADFRATGQTGIMISGRGIAVDAVVADFIAGAAEALSPDAPAEHWDVIEGQGSILHPAYAGVSVGLLHGSQPDAFVVCHDPTRRTLSGMPEFAVPEIERIVALTIELGRVTNPAIRCVGVSLNTSAVSDAERAAFLAEYERRLGVPSFDPMRGGAGRVIDELLRSRDAAQA
ncbi:MAG: DUF1611 domain-containing protein [Pseudomonadota bacterium]